MKKEEISYPFKLSTHTVIKRTTTTKYLLSPNVAFQEVVVNHKKQSGRLLYTGTKLRFREGSLNPVYVKPEFAELIKGGMNPFREWNNEYAFEQFAEALPQDLAELDFSRVYFAYGYAGLLFGPDERIVPITQQVEYITGQFDNEHYKLKKLIEHLKQHPWVIKEVPKGVLGYRIDNEDLLVVKDIPSYNRDPERSKYTEFFILPEVDAYQKLFDVALALAGDTHFSIRIGEYILHPNWFKEDSEDVRALREAGVYDPLGLIPFQKKNQWNK